MKPGVMTWCSICEGKEGLGTVKLGVLSRCSICWGEGGGGAHNNLARGQDIPTLSRNLARE